MMPNAVPISLGGTSIGMVGTIIVQKMAMHIPSKKEGIQATKAVSLMILVDSVNIMNI